MRNHSRSILALSLGLWTVGGSFLSQSQLAAEDVAGFYTDPATGNVFRKVTRTIQTPVVETKLTQRQQTVYTPQTVVENRPTTVRTYSPVTQYRWEPRMEGRWNPFRQPTVAYHHVPATHWEARDQVVNQTATHVQWKAENRTVDVPQRTLSMAQQQKVQYEWVGRVNPQTSVATNTNPASNLNPEVAARLRPLDSGTQIANLNRTPASTYASTENSRNSLQAGIRATELAPNPSGGYGQPTTGSTGVAGLPALSIWR